MDAMIQGIAIAQALEELHAQMVNHSELRPRNVLLTDDKTESSAEFGSGVIIKMIVLTLGASVPDGLVNYLAPEQLGATDLAVGVTCKTDIWALGCILIHMLTGKAPMEGCPAADIVKAVSQTFPHGKRS